MWKSVNGAGQYAFVRYTLAPTRALQEFVGRLPIIGHDAFLPGKVLNLKKKISVCNQRIIDFFCSTFEAVIKNIIFMIFFLYMLPVSFLRSSGTTSKHDTASPPHSQIAERGILNRYRITQLRRFDQSRAFNLFNIPNAVISGTERCRSLLHGTVQFVRKILRQVWRITFGAFVGRFERNETCEARTISPRCVAYDEKEIVDGLKTSSNDDEMNFKGVIHRIETLESERLDDNIVISEAFDRMEAVVAEATSHFGMSKVDADSGPVEWRIRRDECFNTGNISDSYINEYEPKQARNRFHSTPMLHEPTHMYVSKPTPGSSFAADYSTSSESRSQNRFSDARVNLMGCIFIVLVTVALCVFSML